VRSFVACAGKGSCFGLFPRLLKQERQRGGGKGIPHQCGAASSSHPPSGMNIASSLSLNLGVPRWPRKRPPLFYSPLFISPFTTTTTTTTTTPPFAALNLLGEERTERLNSPYVCCLLRHPRLNDSLKSPQAIMPLSCQVGGLPSSPTPSHHTQTSCCNLPLSRPPPFYPPSHRPSFTPHTLLHVFVKNITTPPAPTEMHTTTPNQSRSPSWIPHLIITMFLPYPLLSCLSLLTVVV